MGGAGTCLAAPGHCHFRPTRDLWRSGIHPCLWRVFFRFTGLDWDEHQHLHPDERFLTMVENSLTWPKSMGEYFDTARNPLNPYNHQQGTYVYGLFPVVMAKFIGQVIGKTGYDGVYLAGRGMSAVIDMLCVLLVFLIGRRLYRRTGGGCLARCCLRSAFWISNRRIISPSIPPPPFS